MIGNLCYNYYIKIRRSAILNAAVINKLKELKPVLKERFGIEEFAVFGSVAKGTDTAQSDVDIAVLKMQIKSGFDLIRAKNFLKERLDKEVDLGTFKSMKTFIKNRIEKDFIYV
jgi:predicted nucleotidyltransferase